MKNWCYVEVPGYDEYQPNFQKFVLSQVESSDRLYNYIPLLKFKQHCPDLYRTITDVFGEIHNLAVFKTTRKQMSESLQYNSIHSDSGEKTARLNWPILNPASQITKHFEILDPQFVPRKYIHTPPWPEYSNMYDPTVVKEIDSVCIDRPTVFHVLRPHGMFPGPGDTWPRVMASFNFKGDDLKKYLEDSTENL
jgi:hypothetical protein